MGCCIFLWTRNPEWLPASRTRMLTRGTKDPLDAGNRVMIPSMLMEDGGFISGIPACLLLDCSVAHSEFFFSLS